jgi:pimeloyl-ACP methyl ester carboxylesterase
MSTRSLFRGVLWTLVALLLVAHIGGGWFFSGELIADGFVPDPDPIVTPTGDYEIVEVSYETPLGQMDAFHLPASGTTWVIHVHGKGATPAEAEHLFAPLQEAGYPQLSITYRNDENQPFDPSGYYQYGGTEWEDIRGAMEFAELNGAEAVVFSGFSTGSSHVLSFLYRHNFDEIRGLILDAPNIDFGDTVDFAAGQRDMPVLPMKVPPTITWVAKFITSLRIGVNWKAIDYVDKAEFSLRTPVLVHHGTDDQSVPVTQSVAFVEAAPDLVRLIQVPGAGHIESYQADPQKYVDEVLGFLQEVG